MKQEQIQQRVTSALDHFLIELPSWGFSNTGTRFGKFIQPAAAITIGHKFADAAEVNRLTGAAPTLALHVLWDLPKGKADVAVIRELEKKHGIKTGSINPNLFQDQQYKFGSLCNPSKEIRQQAMNHLLDSIAIGHELNDRDVSLWMADGSNYPGTQSIRKRAGHIVNGAGTGHDEKARVLLGENGADGLAAGGDRRARGLGQGHFRLERARGKEADHFHDAQIFGDWHGGIRCYY